LYRSSETVASARAHWIAELTAALDEADRVAILLGDSHSKRDELAALHDRIQAVRAELDDLRRNGLGEARREINPDWTNLATWRRNLIEQ
jgi:multidrug resistance efflux pump